MRAEMLRSILVICLLATTPVAVYAVSSWPDERKVDVEAREQRERFFDHLAAQQALRREELRSRFDGEVQPRLVRTQ